MMAIKLIVNIESFGEAGCLAWVDEIKGMVVQADSPEEALKELAVSLKVKRLYDVSVKSE